MTTPQDVATDTIRKEIQFCRKMGLKIIGLVENMSGYTCPCCEVCRVEVVIIECLYVMRCVLVLGSVIIYYMCPYMYIV